jgi:hypothetical protein
MKIGFIFRLDTNVGYTDQDQDLSWPGFRRRLSRE